MKFIGITGGVGAGKTSILDYLKTLPDTKVLLADEIAHDLMEKGTDCYKSICQAFEGDDLFSKDMSFDRIKMAAVIFADDKKRETLNNIVHPAVKNYVIKEADKDRKEGKIKLFVLEAALLIEEHYDAICDELWYIYTSGQNRRIRLKSSRGYSDKKIDEIFASQLTDEEYRASCAVEIDNNGTVDQSIDQINDALRRMSYE